MVLLDGRPDKRYFSPLGYESSTDALTENLYLLLLEKDRRANQVMPGSLNCFRAQKRLPRGILNQFFINGRHLMKTGMRLFHR
ncbi:MAG: hypothetical protein A4E65_02830 [Syntrophorhabdus sp. PtaU1.Bin153]|nr:MAG: hypothetical protein A4E65_02830 [Syntrophorhabdus sp. PtaU1.Bin153]